MDGKICLWPQTLGGGQQRQGGTLPSSRWAPPVSPSPALAELPRQQQQQLTTGQGVAAAAAAAAAMPPERTIICKASTNRVRCKELGKGHRAGVSQVAVRGPLGASCGYDGALRLWSLDRAREIAELPAVAMGAPGALGALAPLLQFVWLNAFAAAGSKKGAVTVWDLNKGEIAATIPAAHRGAVGDLQLLLPEETAAATAAAAAAAAAPGTNSDSRLGSVPLLVSGGRADGRLCIFDLRCLPSPVCTAQAHVAAVNAVMPLGVGTGPLGLSTVCTLGGDGFCKAWDLRGMGEERGTSSTTATGSCPPLISIRAGKGGFLCGAPLDDREGLLCAGAADGAVYLLDIKASESQEEVPRRAACWGYGCDSRGAVQTIKTVLLPPANEREEMMSLAILAGGDDGHLAYGRLG